MYENVKKQISKIWCRGTLKAREGKKGKAKTAHTNTLQLTHANLGNVWHMVEAIVSVYERFDYTSPKMAAPHVTFGHSSKARHNFPPISQPHLQDLLCIPTSKTSSERPRKADLLPIKQNCKHQQQKAKCSAHNGGYKFGRYVCGDNV